MSTEQNKATARRFTEEAFNHGNLNVVDEILATDYTHHNAPQGLPSGGAGTKIFVSMFRVGFPDLHITIDDMIAEGDRWRFDTPHEGRIQGHSWASPRQASRSRCRALTSCASTTARSSRREVSPISWA